MYQFDQIIYANNMISGECVFCCACGSAVMETE